MKNICTVIALLVSLPAFNGCSHQHYYYVPNNMPIPALHNRYDALASIATSRFGGWEAQAAFSPFRHTALMYNYLHFEHTSPGLTQGYLHEGGAGVYLAKKPLSCHLIAGYGGGNIENWYSLEEENQTADSRLEIRRWFLQPGFVLQTEGFRFGMAIRQLWLEYDAGTVNINNTPADELLLIQAIEEDMPFRFVEVGISMGIRFRPLIVSINSTWRPVDNSYLDKLSLAGSNYNLMFTLELHELWNREKKSSE